ncbi:MAG: PQQ-binding-like beta-propeller repeat protein [Acidobacteriota bacterium]
MSFLRALRRWFPAAVVLLVLARLLWVRLFAPWPGQEKFTQSVLALLLGGIALFLWMLLASGWRWWVRLGWVVALVAVSTLAFATLRVTGVTGDLVPIFDWRWERTVADDDSAVRAVDRNVDPQDFATVSFPQFLGPDRDATLAGPPLDANWQARPPKQVWRRTMGEGWSAFAVDRGLAVTQEQYGDEEHIVAYELANGEPVWSHGEAEKYESPVAGNGPRATPTIAGERVFAMGSTGRLTAVDFRTGDRLWSRHLYRETGAQLPDWGVAASPLAMEIAGEELVVVPVGTSPAGDGGLLMALDAATGETRWRGGEGRSGYASPVLVTLAGRPQILTFNVASATAHDPADGRVLWRVEWSKAQPNVAQPLVLPGDRVLLSSGYGIGAKLFRIVAGADGTLTPQLEWESPRLKAKFTTLVHHAGAVFGLDDGTLVSLDPATGERHWKRGRYGHGQTLLVGDLLVIVSEKGEVVLVAADPEEYRELARLAAVEGKTWNNPALAGPYLLVRNHREAVCYELPVAPERITSASTVAAGG